MSVRQIENALALLEFFAERKQPATLADVVAHFGWPRSSAFNILSTLAEAGYLYEPRTREGLYPSTRLEALASAIKEGQPLPDALVRIVDRLAETTGETVFVAAPAGLWAVFLEVKEASEAVRYSASPGKKVPIHLTASGLALLSQYSPDARDAVLRKASFDHAKGDAPRSIQQVRDQIDAGRRRGWFRSSSNYSADLGGVSLPYAHEGQWFSITVAGPISRVSDREQKHATMIVEAVRDETESAQ